MKSVIKNLLAGVLVVTLANVGMFTLDQEVAMAANCSLTTTNDMFGSSTRGYCGNDYVNLTTTNDMFGSSTRGYSGNSRINLNSTNSLFGSSTSGYVGNPRTSINSTNTGFSNCFWNC